jgi:SH3 domain-containing YSC84-like protein 1
MRLVWATPLVLLLSAGQSLAAVSTDEAKRLQEAAAVLTEMHKTPDHDIPLNLWNKAACVIVIPNLKKAAFIVGGEYGKGAMSCRNGRAWSAPVFVEMEKGSWGFQAGAEQVDLVLLVMNKRGIDKLLQDKVSLGGEASAAAGPVGRTTTASTDAQMAAEILSWSRAQGVFAGVDLAGGVLKPDKDANLDAYGAAADARNILFGGGAKPPAAASAFMTSLRHESVAAATQ